MTRLGIWLLLGALVLGGCADQPRACGEWPALVVSPIAVERVVERRYLSLLGFYDRADAAEWRRFAILVPEFGLLFFETGEPVRVVRAGELSDRTVLVRTVGRDRFWVTWDEVSCR